MSNRGSVGRAGVVLSLLLAMAPAASAAGGSAAERIRDLDVKAVVLTAEAAEIRQNFTERSGLIGVSEARQRYEDAVYLFLVRDFEAAASSFYILVQSRALGNEALARDSEWYLAECLFELGNYRTSEEAYRSIIEKGTSQPYFQDSVRRILEVYGLLGDTDQFDRYYSDFIVTGKVPTTENITYTLAKSFYRRGEFSRAKGAFEGLLPSSPYYTRARYFLGVLMIRENNYPQSIAEYQRVVAVVPTDSAQQEILELSQLALARLYYETGDFAAADTWYQKIGEKSPYWADKLYESVWTYIKQANGATEAAGVREGWESALKQVDAFLLAFPEHKYSAGLKLLQGHLQMKLSRYEDARTAYERVVDEYTPLVERLDGVAGTEQLRRLLEGVTGGDAGVSERLPAYAVGALMADEQVSRATGAWRSTAEQRAEIAASERIVNDLLIAMSGGTDVLGTFVTARLELSAIRGSTLSVRDQLLDTEATWLRGRVPTQYRTDLSALQKERSTVLTSVAAIDASAGKSGDREQIYDEQVREVQQRAFRLSQVVQEGRALAASTMEQVGHAKLLAAEAGNVRAEIVRQQRDLDVMMAELDSVQSEVLRKKLMRSVQGSETTGDQVRRAAVIARYADLRRKISAHRGYVADAEAVTVFAGIDRLWRVVDTLEQATEETAAVLGSAEARELTAVRARLTREAQRVVELRRDIDRQSIEAETVAIHGLRDGLTMLEDDFRSSILEADRGIVDVYWLRKSSTTDEIAALGAEQRRLLDELDAQFRIVRENLDR